MVKPVIFIISDQLPNLEKLPCEIRDNLKGYQAWKSKCLNLKRHYVASIPCSPSRANIYTGYNSNVTKMSDNSNNAWQNSLNSVSDGLPTLGTRFKNKGYETRYLGKWHLSHELDRNEILKYKPTIAVENDLKKYDFDIFNKIGDFGYGINGGFYNDVDLMEQTLPNGNDPDKCDYYNHNTDTAYDGVLPYLKNQYNKGNKKFLCVINFQNPHDITYSNVIDQVNNPTSATPSLQFSGDPANNYRTNAFYNKNYRKYINLPLINKNSCTIDNVNNSTTNTDPLYVARIYYLVSNYYGYGITQENLLSYQYYQNNYLQMIKQVDTQFYQLYKFLEKYDYFNTAVIVLSSDHGDYNASHGVIGKSSMIYEEAWNTTCLISYPHMKYRGKDYNYITSSIQLVPTVMLLSGNYTEEDINDFNLFPSIFHTTDGTTSCGNCRGSGKYKTTKKDFLNLKLNLSIGYGPLFLPLLRSLDNDTINNDINNKIPKNINFFTLAGFSVSCNLRYQEKFYNVGYYFSIYQIFISNLGRISFDLGTILPSGPIIMYNALNSSGLAFVGTADQIYQQLFSNAYFVNLYFVNLKIEPFIGAITTQYTLVVGTIPTIYGTSIYANSPIFDAVDVIELIQSVTPTLPNPFVILYDAAGSGSLYAYVGTPDYITFLQETNPVIQTWTIPTKITNSLNGYTIYVCNDPIFQEALIYTKLTTSIPTIIGDLNLITYVAQIFASAIPTIAAIILGNINYDNFNSVQYLLNLYLSQLNNYILPGLNNDVNTLLSNGFQVQVFNNTDDPEELYNLADSSRISNNTDLINNLLTILNQHIVYNNCQNVFISLPRNLLFTQLFIQLKTYMLDDVPKIYNYSLLEGNNFNKTNG
jgi:arylsulfatase A-like enzyme